MNIEEEGFYKPIVACAERWATYTERELSGLIGTGTINWEQVFRGLTDAKYRGPLVLESFAAINPDLAAATCLWRPPNQPPGVLATEGLRFLREGAARAGLV